MGKRGEANLLDGQEEREAVCGVGGAVGRERRSEA